MLGALSHGGVGLVLGASRGPGVPGALLVKRFILLHYRANLPCLVDLLACLCYL